MLLSGAVAQSGPTIQPSARPFGPGSTTTRAGSSLIFLALSVKDPKSTVSGSTGVPPAVSAATQVSSACSELKSGWSSGSTADSLSGADSAPALPLTLGAGAGAGAAWP